MHVRMPFLSCFRAENGDCVHRSRRCKAGMSAAVRDDGLLLDMRASCGGIRGRLAWLAGVGKRKPNAGFLRVRNHVISTPTKGGPNGKRGLALLGRCSHAPIPNRGKLLFVVAAGQSAGGVGIWNTTAGNGQLDVGCEGASMKKVVEHVVFTFVGHDASYSGWSSSSRAIGRCTWMVASSGTGTVLSR